MSELNAAMEAAVASVDAERRRRPAAEPTDAPRRAPQQRPDLVLVRDDQDLPPIVRRHAPKTFTETLRDQYGPVAVTILTTVREAALLLVLFWVSAIVLAFVEVEGAVTIPGVGDATVISVALLAATVLRAVFAAARRSGQPRDARRR